MTELTSSSSENASAQPTSAVDGLHFSRLHVKRLYGIDHGLEIDSFCGDVNVIYGANASGKTTIARAIRGLLWPDCLRDDTPILSARFELGSTPWRVDLEGKHCKYQKEHQPAQRPPLPPSSHDGRYHLYLHDLLSLTDGEDDFARAILQEAYGGIDLQGVAQELGFEVPSRRKSGPTRKVENAREDLRKAEKEQEKLQERERNLSRLREKRAEAKEAKKRKSALEQAIEAAKAREDRDKAQAKLEAFPQILEEVRGTEVEDLESLQEEKETAEEQVQEAEEEIAGARSVFVESIIPEEGIPEGQLAKIKSKVSSLKDAERDAEDANAKLEGKKEEEKRAWEKLSAGVDKERAADINLPAFEEVESHAQKVEEVQGRQEALKTLEQLLEEEGPEESVDALREGLRQLHRWLQHWAPDSGSASGVWSTIILLSALLIGGAGAALAVYGQGISLWIGVGLLAIAIVLAAGEVYARGRKGGGQKKAHSVYEREYESLGLGSPAAWNRDAVEDQSDRLFERLQEAKVAEAKQSEWSRLEPEREEIEERANKLQKERKRLDKEIGLKPNFGSESAGSRSLAWLVERLSQWQTAYDKVEGLETRLNEAEKTVSRLRNELDGLLKPYGLDGIGDGSEAEKALNRLDSAQAKFEQAEQTFKNAKHRKEKAQEDKRNAEEGISQLYDRLNLEEGEEGKLRSLVEQHEDYQEAIKEESTKSTFWEAERKQLRRCEGHEEWMEEATQKDLEQQLEDVRTEAEKEEDYHKEITTIENQISDAEKGGTLEQLHAKYREKLNRLASDRQRDYEKAAGAVLAELIQERTRNQGLPPVFQRAKELFAKITNDRYELDLDREAHSFRAIDNVEDRGFPLEALSSGTKVQLLLSVRVAFVESQEEGCCVPLVLDETLANSDDEKARAIIEAIRTICESGRQVIYLTAQRDEVQKWNACLRDVEGVDCRIIPLPSADTREMSEIRGDGAPIPARVTAVELTDGETLTHEELGQRLQVPRWSPRQPVKRIHLWYLVENFEPLAELVREGTTTWGKLALRHRRGGLAATRMGKEYFRHVEALAKAVKSWREAWKVGRGRKVDRTVLEQSGAVSKKFIDGVSELAEELDGDAEALLEELRVKNDERAKGFYSSKADELETYLQEEGYIDPREPMSEDDMWLHVVTDLVEDREAGIVENEDLERLFDRIQEGPPDSSSDA